MARTKNTARSNPFELPRATVTDHVWAITATTNKEVLEVKEIGGSLPTEVKECQVENVESVACLDVNSPKGEPETPLNPDAGLHTPSISCNNGAEFNPSLSKWGSKPRCIRRNHVKQCGSSLGFFTNLFLTNSSVSGCLSNC